MHVTGSISPANEREPFSFQEEGVAMPTSPPSPIKFSDIEDTRTKPPPPPPPLPPPLPPLLSGLGDPTGGGLRRKRKVRSFYWKTIPEEQVKGRSNLWTQGRVQQQYQIDVQTVEELFGQNDRQSDANATPTRGGKLRSSFRETKEEISILDSKRGMNIGIFLKQFKRSNQMIVDDIRQGNSGRYGAETLRELLKLLPETEEVKKLKAYRDDVSKLSLADSFVYLLIQLPSYSVRIESMLLKEEFPAACEIMKRDIGILRSATKELMCCEELHAVLHLVLQAGNILNAGGYAGNAVGFKLSSLLSLADTKANKPGMNLLHFVALEAQKKDEKLLEFALKLPHVQPAARISLETLDAELRWIMTRTRSVEESVQRDTELLQQLDDFLQHATSALCSLRNSRQQLQKEGNELIDFFCEDRDTFRLDDCFSIFHTFCSRFTNAVKENVEREAKEAARRQRLQQLEEQKRHSWAAGEEVSGVFKSRCSSETDMSAVMTQGLMEPLAPRSCPRSPLINSHSPLGRSGSLRRSRKSPSTSPSLAAERELSMLLEMARPEWKVAQQRGWGETTITSPSASSESGLTSPGFSHQNWPQSPKVTTCSFPKNQQPHVGQRAPQTPSSPPKTSLSPKNINSHRTTTSYLSSNSTQTPVDAINTANKVTVKPTSDSDQQFDHNNNGKGRKGEPPTMNKAEPDLTGLIHCSEDQSGHSSAATNNLSVVLETCTLVPDLKVFNNVSTLTSYNKIHHTHEYQLNDIVITDLEEEAVDKSQVQKVQINSQTRKVEESKTCSSLAQREEEEGQEEKVVVWCVTGVCEAASELTDAENIHTQSEKDQCRRDGEGGNQQTSSSSANRTPSEPQLANEKPVPVPVPISSQPVPVSRSDDLSLQASSPRWCPVEPSSTSEAPADACEEDKESTNQVEETGGSTNENVEILPEKSIDDRSRDKSASCKTSENTEAASSPNGKVELPNASSPSTKNLLTAKTRPAGIKVTTPNITSANKSQPIRTLTNTENQDMRRVVPISRSKQGPQSLGKCPEKLSDQRRGSCSTVSTPSSSNHQQGKRPSTAPSSRRSSINKTPMEPKTSKDQKVSGTQATAREQNKDFQRKSSIRKSLQRPKPQPEEKMCRSTLRALAQARVGGGGSVSAPATPLHKTTNPSSSPIPGFARSTASSSFRKTHTALVPPHSSYVVSNSSPKSSPKITPSSVPPSSTTTSFTRTGSLKVSATSRPSDVLNPNPVVRSQSIKTPARSPIHDPLAPPKGHGPSEKSSHSRDSGKATRPTWR